MYLYLVEINIYYSWNPQLHTLLIIFILPPQTPFLLYNWRFEGVSFHDAYANKTYEISFLWRHFILKLTEIVFLFVYVALYQDSIRLLRFETVKVLMCIGLNWRKIPTIWNMWIELNCRKIPTIWKDVVWTKCRKIPTIWKNGLN